MRKFAFILFIISLLFAGEYITLENGKVIELKPDGTWQEVKVVKKNDETIAIKPDGTWEKVQATKVEAANSLERAIDKKYKDEPLVKNLLGKWQGDGVYYNFRKDKAIFKEKVGHSNRVIEGKWIVEKIDDENNIVIVNIGEGARLGFLTFGGAIRHLQVKNDNTIVDLTEKLEGKVYTLHKLR